MSTVPLDDFFCLYIVLIARATHGMKPSYTTKVLVRGKTLFDLNGIGTLNGNTL